MTADARRYAGQKSSERTRLAATAVIGASLAVRTMSYLIMNALRLAGKPASPVFFCSTHEEAMKWLDVQRQLFRAAKK
jgi:hypothetical protein